MLLDAETRYSMAEKLVLALVNIKKKVKAIFRSALSHGVHGLPPLIDFGQARPVRTVNQMGYRAGDLRYRVPASSGKEREGHGRLPSGNPVFR